MIMSEDRDKTKELLSAYIDGEVTPEQLRSVEHAVARDPELALELHELTAAKQLVTGLPRQRAPRGFVRRVMARAERKHLLGDHQAGGSFSGAKWITLAVAAVVLLTAGVGIIAINMLGTSQDPSSLATLDDDDRNPGGPENMDLGEDRLRGRTRTDVNKEGGKAGNGARLVVADAAFDYAVANAKNASIYTHDVSNTLAVLHETFNRNDVLPLELEAPARSSKAAAKLVNKPAVKAADEPAAKPAAKAATKKRNVSRGGLNFYYNKKQDTEQVQIVVLATDTVIEKLNGDLDKIARVQMVSQAPAPDPSNAGSGQGFFARRAGPRGAQRGADPSGRDEEEVVIARVDDDNTGLGTASLDRKAGKGDRLRAKSKMIAKDTVDHSGGKKAPAPVVPAAPKTAKPAVEPAAGTDNSPRPSDVTMGAGASVAARSTDRLPQKSVSQTGDTGSTDAPGAAIAGTGGQKKSEVADKSDVALDLKTARPWPAKRPVSGPTTRPAETVQLTGEIQQDLLDNNSGGELASLSARIAEEQKLGNSVKRIEEQYSKLNKAFRRQILNDDIRRNVQSQQEQGVNIQALVININRRSLRGRKTAATQSGLMLRDGGALSRPRATTASSPVSESTTQKSVSPVDTSR